MMPMTIFTTIVASLFGEMFCSMKKLSRRARSIWGNDESSAGEAGGRELPTAACSECTDTSTPCAFGATNPCYSAERALSFSDLRAFVVAHRRDEEAFASWRRSFNEIIARAHTTDFR